MTVPLVSENTKASLDPDAAALARRYGAEDRLPVVYRAPQQATSKVEDDRGGDLTVRRAKIKPTDYVAKYRIGNEMFLVRRKGRGFMIQHPVWSLMGLGKTLWDAEQDLRFHAGNVADILGRKAGNELGVEAVRLHRFALSIS